jgi:N12 class adenine-specific DNA methylase
MRLETTEFIVGTHKEETFRYNGDYTCFDGRSLDSLKINIELLSQKDFDDLIDLLTITKHCFYRPR